MKNLFKKLLVVGVSMFALVGCVGGDSSTKITEDATAYFNLYTFKEVPSDEKFTKLKEEYEATAMEQFNLIATSLGLPEEFATEILDASKTALSSLPEPTIEVADVEDDKELKEVSFTFFPLDSATAQTEAAEAMEDKIAELGETPTEEDMLNLLSEVLIASYINAKPATESVTIKANFKNVDGNWEPENMISFMSDLSMNLFILQ